MVLSFSVLKGTIVKNRILVFAMSAIAAIGMISCGNPSGDAEDIKSEIRLSVDNVDTYIASIGQYNGLTVEAIKEEMTEDMVAYYSKYFFENEASAIEGWVAKEGDTVNVDFVGKIGNEAFEGGTGTDQLVEIGSHTYIEGFEDGLIGSKAGDEFTLNLSFPENYKNGDLAGKDCSFDIKVNSVIPAFTDAGVKALNNELFSTVNEFKVYISDVLKDFAVQNYEDEVIQGVINSLVESSVFNEFDKDILIHEREIVLENFRPYAEAYDIDTEYYLELTGSSVEMETLKYAKQHALFFKIAKDNNLMPTEEDIQKEISVYIEYYDEISDEDDYYANIMDKDSLVEALMLNNIYDYLLGVTEVVTPVEE